MLGEPVIGRELDNLYRLYRIDEQLNAGWLAVTYRARRLESGSVVAVKSFRPELSRDALQAFEMEVAAWDALRHPNVVAVADRGLHASRPWLANRWLQGETLAARLAHGPLQLSAALTIFRPVMAALASAHAARLAHRNLKPSNVLLEQPATHRRERALLLDFMPAGALSTPPPPSVFRAPEVIAGQPADARSDVYAAGMLLIAMLTDANSDEAEPSRAVPGVSGALLAWIRRATASEAARRFSDAGTMLGELIDVLPRELRSGQTVGDEVRRASTQSGARVSKSQPPAAAAASAAPARPSQPAPAKPASTPPPPIASEPAPASEQPITVPPPPRMPIEARGLGEGADGSTIEVHGAAPALPSLRDEACHSLRPTESLTMPAHDDRWSRLLMAAGAAGAIAIAGFTLVREVKHMQRERPRAMGPARAEPPAQPAATPAPEAEPAPLIEPPAAAQLPAAVPAPPTQLPVPPVARPLPPVREAPSPAFTIVAAPGRPAIRDPWSDPISPELKRLHEASLKGALADESRVKWLLEYNRDHRNDVRGYLVIGKLYLNRLWRTDCVEEWATALQRDPGVRGAPEVLPGLIEIIMQGKAAPIAQSLLLEVYGSEALFAIDEALDTVRDPDAALRLHNLRVKITERERP